MMYRLTALLAFLLALAPSAATARPSDSGLPRTSVVDNSQRIDVNNISMFVTNTGSFAWDKVDPGQPAGLEFPKGTGQTAVFAAGLLVGGQGGGGAPVALAAGPGEGGAGPVPGGGGQRPRGAGG